MSDENINIQEPLLQNLDDLMPNDDSKEYSFQYIQERCDGPFVNISIPNVKESNAKIIIKDSNEDVTLDLKQNMKVLQKGILLLGEQLRQPIKVEQKDSCSCIGLYFMVILNSILIIILIAIVAK